MTNIKKGILVAAALVISFAGYAVAGPFISMNAIKSGIEQKDSERLSENIDFQALRQNLKDQFNAQMMTGAFTELDSNPFGVLAVGLASKLVDGMVDGFITPSGLAALMSGETPAKGKADQSGTQKPIESQKLFENAHFGFDSTRKFSIRVPNDKGEEIQFLLTRSGLDWRLSNIIIPMNKG